MTLNHQEEKKDNIMFRNIYLRSQEASEQYTL